MIVVMKVISTGSSLLDIHTYSLAYLHIGIVTRREMILRLYTNLSYNDFHLTLKTLKPIK